MTHKLQETLLSANATLDPLKAKSLYTSVREGARDKAELLALYVSASRELAYLSPNESNRSALWKDAYRRLSCRIKEDILFLEDTAILLKDIILDNFSGVDLSFQSRELSRLLKLLSLKSFDAESDASDRSRLLVRRSSLLRLRSDRFDISHSTKKKTLDEALRCAEKALAESEHTGAQFELAVCLWANSNAASSDEEYKRILERVESLLSSPHIQSIDVAKLTLARFYRMIYRPLEACETFESLTQSISHHRRILRDVATIAEAAIHLWFQNYPESVWRPYTETARFITREAIDSGYRSARNLVNLAYLHQILGNSAAAGTSLLEIADVPQDSIWNKLVELSHSCVDLDEATEGLCYGMTSGITWTRLGTFVWTFFDDLGTVQALYEFAVKLSPRNPIVLTNLARFHIRSGSEYSKIESEKLLQRAHSYSSRRFRWWRILMDELRDEAGVSCSKKLTELPERRQVLAGKLKVVRSRYKKICNLENAQKQGYELEHIVFDLANISFKVVAPSYRFKRESDVYTQIDGYLEHRGEKYRIECKWEKYPAPKDHLVKFLDSIDVIGISGMFISMSGFSGSFIQRAREYRKERAIILFDHEDIESVVNGKINFDELLTFKRLSFDKDSEPFARLRTYQD